MYKLYENNNDDDYCIGGSYITVRSELSQERL